MPKPEEKFTAADLETVADDLGMLKYFTHELRAPAIALLARICSHKRALFYLRDELVNHVGYWPGPAEVRGLLDNCFDPADRVHQWCSLPGHTAADGEARSLAKHEELKAQAAVGGYVSEESTQLLKRLAAEMKQLPKPIAGEAKA
jgi:hypothetical protein